MYKIPQTEAVKQKRHSLDHMQDWWLSKLDDGLLFEGRIVAVRTVVDDYTTHCGRPEDLRHASEVRVGRFLKKYCPPGWPRKWRSSVRPQQPGPGLRQWEYEFPPLCRLRERWREVVGWAPEWWVDR